MAKPKKDMRAILKGERERDRQAKKTEKLAKRRETREQQPEPQAARLTEPPASKSRSEM